MLIRMQSAMPGLQLLKQTWQSRATTPKFRSEVKRMKKLFISAPMKGRTEAQIRATMEQMHHIAEAVFGEELEVIQTYISDDPPENTNMAIWYLGESIKKLSEADRFIGIYDEEKGYRGCIIENLVAKNYSITSYLVNISYVAPDIIEQKRRDERIANLEIY